MLLKLTISKRLKLKRSARTEVQDTRSRHGWEAMWRVGNNIALIISNFLFSVRISKPPSPKPMPLIRVVETWATRRWMFPLLPPVTCGEAHLPCRLLTLTLTSWLFPGYPQDLGLVCSTVSKLLSSVCWADRAWVPPLDPAALWKTYLACRR